MRTGTGKRDDQSQPKLFSTAHRPHHPSQDVPSTSPSNDADLMCVGSEALGDSWTGLEPGADASARTLIWLDCEHAEKSRMLAQRDSRTYCVGTDHLQLRYGRRGGGEDGRVLARSRWMTLVVGCARKLHLRFLNSRRATLSDDFDSWAGDLDPPNSD